MALIMCLYIMIQFSCSSAFGINEGKEFLISTPSMKLPFNEDTGYPRLVLTLMSSVAETIKVVTKAMTNTINYLEKDLFIQPFKSVKFYNKTLFFGPDQKSGVRWTLHLTCDNPFVVMVSMETDVDILETFTAVPVSGWGSHYIVTTLDKHFSVVLIAGELKNVLTFTFKAQPEPFTLSVNGLEHEQGSEFEIELSSYQSYSIDNCAENGIGALTGSSVDGILPFGVVCGNCNGYTHKCISKPDSSLMDGLTGSTVAEMLLPVESLGQRFVVVSVTGRSSDGYVIVVASQNDTEVWFTDESQNDRTKYVKIVLKTKGDWHTESASFVRLEAHRPVYVTYVQNSSCRLTSDGDPSIMMLIPVELFYLLYTCIIPDTRMRHFISLVVHALHIDRLQVMYIEGENPIITCVSFDPRDIVFYMTTYHVWEYEVKRGVSFTLYLLESKFGCYVHGVGSNATYMHPAGFYSSNINQAYCINSEKSMKKGDFLDNDCDGKVDEERENGKDDDLTSYREPNPIDEDLGFYFEKSDTINVLFTSVPDNMGCRTIWSYSKDYIPHGRRNTTECVPNNKQNLSISTKDYATPARVFSTRAQKTTTAELNLENYTSEGSAFAYPAKKGVERPIHKLDHGTATQNLVHLTVLRKVLVTIVPKVAPNVLLTVTSLMVRVQNAYLAMTIRKVDA